MREPWSQEAEQGVLGAMLIKPELIDILSADLKPTDFYFGYNRQVYKSIITLHGNGQAVDVVTVGDHIGTLDNGEFALPYVVDLHRNTPSAANAKEYVRIVLSRSVDRELMNACRAIQEIAEADGEPNDKIMRAEAEISSIQSETSKTETIGAGEALRAHMDELERREQMGGKMDGLSTGITALDDLMTGMKPEQLIVIAGRPKMGKTTLAMNISDHVAVECGKQVLVFSLEMSNQQLMDKSLANLGGIPLKVLKTGAVFKSHPQQLTDTMTKINASGLTLYSRKSATINQIRSASRRHKMRHGLDLVIVDHIGLVDVEDSRASPVQRTSEITRSLKLLAKELGCPVIALSQLNRALEQRPNKRPIPSDLRDSGSIEQDADMIVFVYRDEVYNEHTEYRGIAEIIVAVSRDSEPGTARARYQGNYSSFSDMTGDEQHQPATTRPVRSGRPSLLD